VGRSLKKGPYVDPRVLERVERMNDSGRKEPLKTWSRRCDIVPEFVGHTFLVHNGNKFLRVYVTEDMVGHKLGEFAPTRLFRAHSTRRVEEAPAEGAAGGKK
jgi:small subunit ribosomal protein S19